MARNLPMLPRAGDAVRRRVRPGRILTDDAGVQTAAREARAVPCTASAGR